MIKNPDFIIAMILNIPAFFIYSFANNFMDYLIGIPLTVVGIILILGKPIEKYTLTKEGEEN